jgi:hypothetical protein
MSQHLRMTAEEFAEHQAKRGRTANLPPERRTEIARDAANARWAGNDPAKPRKYRNKPVYLDRVWFDSIAESKHYQMLRLRELAGEIRDLIVHPVFALHFGESKIGRYVGDFRYVEDGKEVVVDVKSHKTAELSTFRLKVKHVKAEHGVDVVVVFA